jgi:hypothetical protein
MNQETAVAIQNPAQVVERRANVQVGNIDMPMLVRLRRLVKAGPFLRGLSVPPQEGYRHTTIRPLANFARTRTRMRIKEGL